MKLFLESTDKIVIVDGAPAARVWRGEDETGVPVIALIRAVSPQTHDDDINAKFAARLQELKRNSTAYDLRFFVD